MKGLKSKVVPIFGATLLLFSGCRENVEPVEPRFVGLERPAHFPEPIWGQAGTPSEPTQAGFNLGRRLFYDPVLSADSSVSCASCHAQVHAFADHNTVFSVGVGGASGTRNSPALSNLAWHPHFMADGGITHIEVMPLAPLQMPHEMGANLLELAERFSEDPLYGPAFEQVFGSTPVTGQQILLALTQFQVALVSAGSRYDEVMLGAGDFTPAEACGHELFELHCATCHAGPLLSDFTFANTGLDFYSADPGRFRITLNPADSGAFKVPSLRNVALTRPYMHDGRFWNLESVVAFYASDVVDNGRLDPRLPGPLNLTEADQMDLVSFLHTLTDHDYTYDARWADPF